MAQHRKTPPPGHVPGRTVAQRKAMARQAHGVTGPPHPPAGRPVPGTVPGRATRDRRTMSRQAMGALPVYTAEDES
jgi:hypothetical protein